MNVDEPKEPYLVPDPPVSIVEKFLEDEVPFTEPYFIVSTIQEYLGHLRWMFQKYKLRQDMFLIGPPGTWRRYLVLAFAYLLRKEVEYVTITTDTSDTDLKVRREIHNG